MSETAQRVVVIQDASRDISSEVLRGALQGLQLKPGDELTLLGVLHQVNTPMGYKSRIDSSFGPNRKVINEAIANKIEEYRNSMELLQIRKMYEMHQVSFNVKVVATSSPKNTAVETAQKLRATWIILDRQMKKDKKYFLDKLSCGISRMKRDDSVEQLRGPKGTGTNAMPTVGSRNSPVTYHEMIPGTPETSENKIPETSDTNHQRIPATSDAFENKMPGSPEDDDCFSLELVRTHIRSPLRNRSVEEPRNDNEKAPPWSTTVRSFLSKTRSSEHLHSLTPYPWNADASTRSSFNEATSTSSFNEEKHTPLHNQEEESHTNTKRAVPDDGLLNTISAIQELGHAEDRETLFQDPGQRQSCVDDYDFFNELTEWQPEERFENSVCPAPDCLNERPKIGWKRDFTYEELEVATEKFSDKNYISEGGFGSVYKGKLKNGLMIAVKQHKDASFQGEKEFKAEVHVLSKARHRNVVMLLGSCSQENHRLLVYEFVCNGSLDKHISRDSPVTLSWVDRMKIALGAARGLNYLHGKNIIHRDMRPNNILVTHNYEPMLGDFGLARTQHEGSDHSSDTRVVGTFGYLAPEYAESGKASTKTDVYSFGMVLLELITGRTPMDKTLNEESLVGWARPLLKEKKYPDLIDSRILDSHDVLQLFWMVRVAEKCLRQDPDKRLSMDKVVQALERIMDGETVTGFEDFSPAHSISSMPEYSDSKVDNEKLAKGRPSPEDSPTSGSRTEVSSTSSWSQLSEALSAASSIKTFSTRSSITLKSSEGSIPSDNKSYKKKRSKTRSQYQVLYGEMLN
ncbi:hypothetical protein AAC387_Pa02g4679 [Persea americana]